MPAALGDRRGDRHDHGHLVPAFAVAATGFDAAAVAAELPLGDACLAISGTYHADTAGLVGVLHALGGDLPAFLARVKQAAETDDPRAALLGEPSEGPAG